MFVQVSVALFDDNFRLNSERFRSYFSLRLDSRSTLLILQEYSAFSSLCFSVPKKKFSRFIACKIVRILPAAEKQ